MREASFTVVYDGPALADHRINVRDLAPALLALAALVEEANRTCNGDRAKVSLAVKANTPGSFEVDLQLIQTLLQKTKGFLLDENFAAAEKIKALLFGDRGLFDLIKRLRGKKPKAELPKGDEVHLDLGESTHIVINRNVYHLYGNAVARQAVEEIVRPLSEEGIDALRIREEDILLEEILRDDRASFLAPTRDEPETEPILDETYRKALTVVSPDFKEGNKWRVSDGQHEFYVAMMDAAFNAEVERGDVAFAKGDVLICKLRARQTRTGTKLSTEYEAIEVLDRRKAARQLKLGT